MVFSRGIGANDVARGHILAGEGPKIKPGTKLPELQKLKAILNSGSLDTHKRLEVLEHHLEGTNGFERLSNEAVKELFSGIKDYFSSKGKGIAFGGKTLKNTKTPVQMRARLLQIIKTYKASSATFSSLKGPPVGSNHLFHEGSRFETAEQVLQAQGTIIQEKAEGVTGSGDRASLDAYRFTAVLNNLDNGGFTEKHAEAVMRDLGLETSGDVGNYIHKNIKHLSSDELKAFKKMKPLEAIKQLAIAVAQARQIHNTEESVTSVARGSFSPIEEEGLGFALPDLPPLPAGLVADTPSPPPPPPSPQPSLERSSPLPSRASVKASSSPLKGPYLALTGKIDDLSDKEAVANLQKILTAFPGPDDGKPDYASIFESVCEALPASAAEVDQILGSGADGSGPSERALFFAGSSIGIALTSLQARNEEGGAITGDEARAALKDIVLKQMNQYMS